jgi:predicted secreted hydrolase
VALSTPSGPKSFRVAGVYRDYSNDKGTILLDRPLYLSLFGDPRITSVAVLAARGADADELRRRILSLARGRYALSVTTNRELRREILAIFDRTFAVARGLEAIAVAVAILGIANALTASAVERRRAFGLLAAIGAEEGQIRRAVLVEAALTGSTATLAAIVAAAAFAYLLLAVINPQSFGWTAPHGHRRRLRRLHPRRSLPGLPRFGRQARRRPPGRVKEKSGDLRSGDRVIGTRSIIRWLDHRIARLPIAAAALLVATAADRNNLTFPRDHGSHADAAIEWWYYTGHLRDASRREYGFELTFFRLKELSLAHFAWTDVSRKKFRYEEKAHLILPGVAGAEAGRLAVFNEDWSVMESGGRHRLHAAARDFDLALELSPAKPPVLHGEGGISRKGPGAEEYSRYVSIPRLTASGKLRSGGSTEPLTGTAWFDHEWGPGAMPSGASGWDWFGVQLDDGSELMLYRMRGKTGGATPFSSGTFIPREGAPRPLRWSEVTLAETASWKSPRTGARYPSGWRLAIAPLRLDLAVTPLLPDQELITEQSTGVIYWEGACRVEGAREGRPVSGRAYAELTGYARPDVPGFAQ